MNFFATFLLLREVLRLIMEAMSHTLDLNVGTLFLSFISLSLIKLNE
jgi:hypothetical protein